ncbi:MAG: hypothetical protein Q7R30_14030 [Acidobacteriota bacterium]|nr:hypothetical protein [Acidobacteriota bacterium]
MTSSAAIGLSIRKEARALLPMWAACASALIVVGIVGDPRFAEAGRLVYFLGSAALASWSIGHEYSHRTLPILLSLPSTRPRLLLMKLGVLIPLLATLGALALTILPPFRGFGRQESQALIPALAVVCALILAPLVTMLCRSPLAGVVFALVITGWVHLLAQIAGLVVYGSAELLIQRDQLTMTLRLWGFLSVSALAAVAGWLAFMQLEAIDGLPDVHWPHGWRRAAAARPVARRRNPFWLLALKELRLQQMTFIVAGLFILGAIAVTMLRTVIPEFNGSPEPIVALYGLLLAWLIGSLASAEERHLGTLEWHTLLPVAAWQQWSVKAGITLGLAILLGIGLPMLVIVLVSSDILNPMHPVYLGVIVVLATASLYVSTLCSSGLRALTVSGPAILVVFLPLGRMIEPFDADLRSPYGVLVLAGLLLLALRFAFENHRSAERSLPRVGRQLLLMAAVPLLALIIRRL